MRKLIFLAILTAAFVAVAVFGKTLSGRCDELREKQARQEAVLLKQSEILAVNTALLQTVVSSLLRKNNPGDSGRERLKMDVIP